MSAAQLRDRTHSIYRVILSVCAESFRSDQCAQLPPPRPSAAASHWQALLYCYYAILSRQSPKDVKVLNRLVPVSTKHARCLNPLRADRALPPPALARLSSLCEGPVPDAPTANPTPKQSPAGADANGGCHA